MSGFPLAEAAQAARRRGETLPKSKKSFNSAKMPSSVEINLTELKGNDLEGLREQARHGNANARREATVKLEMLKAMDGQIDKYFVEDHPRLLVDLDGDIYDTADGRTKGKRIEGLRSSTPAEVPYDDSARKAAETAARVEDARKWQERAKNPGRPLADVRKPVG